MSALRWAVVILGLALPYLVRLPGGPAWLRLYDGVFDDAMNALAWGGLLPVSALFRRPIAFAVPCAATFGPLGWFHAVFDPAGDAQSALFLLILPVLAMVPLAAGTVAGLALQWVLDRRGGAGSAPDRR